MKLSICFSNKDHPIKTAKMIDTNISIECPHCRRITQTPFLSSFFTNDNFKLSSICQCGNCYNIFYSTFTCDSTNLLTIKNIFPNKEYVHKFANEINEISHDFISIYSQAMQAKNLGLDDLVGPGLRKATEFLCFDYISNILKQTPKTKLVDMLEQINIQNANIHGSLIRIIGNDETHTIRKHPDLDLELMIKCVDSFVYYLIQEYLSIENQRVLDSLSKSSL